MSLIQKKNSDFTAKKQDPRAVPESTVIVKGGSTIVDGSWINIPSNRIDIKRVVLDFINDNSRRVFNHFNDILYVLITVDKTSKIEVLPSISFNKKSFGEVKIFPDLSGKIPLMLVKLRQDGSGDLKAIKEIRKEDIEIYNGYGNYTPRGPEGAMGATGIRGINGEQGIQGIPGEIGPQGLTGIQGTPGYSSQGVTGPAGRTGEPIPTLLLERSLRVDFTGTPRVGSEPLTVEFQNLTVGSVTSWHWDFGDGGTSSEQNPVHTYLYDGAYDVSLRAVVSAGGSTEYKASYIVVTDVYFIQDTTDPNEINWLDTVDSEEINVQDSPEL